MVHRPFPWWQGLVAQGQRIKRLVTLALQPLLTAVEKLLKQDAKDQLSSEIEGSKTHHVLVPAPEAQEGSKERVKFYFGALKVWQEGTKIWVVPQRMAGDQNQLRVGHKRPYRFYGSIHKALVLVTAFPDHWARMYLTAPLHFPCSPSSKDSQRKQTCFPTCSCFSDIHSVVSGTQLFRDPRSTKMSRASSLCPQIGKLSIQALLQVLEIFLAAALRS